MFHELTFSPSKPLPYSNSNLDPFLDLVNPLLSYDFTNQPISTLNSTPPPNPSNTPPASLHHPPNPSNTQSDSSFPT